MSQKFAMIFPGQGSQSVGMLSELADNFPAVKLIFEQASTILKYDLWELVQSGPAEKLDQTVFTQPALLAADIAVWTCFQKLTNLKPDVVAGHSLGEYAALVVAEVFTFEEAVQLVSDRGRFMQEAVSVGTGAMAAIVGLDDAVVLTICERASAETNGLVSAANFNSIGQVVIAGEKKAVLAAIELATQAGARMAKLIPVSVPSHCALMRPAADYLAIELKKLELKKINIISPKIKVIHNIDAKSHADSADMLAALKEQLTQPVRWVETIQAITAQGVNLFLECGPGRVLAGLNKRISRDIQTINLQTELEIREAIKIIQSA